MIKATLVLYLAMLCAAIGNVFLRKGMKRIGPLKHWRPIPLFKFFWNSLTSFYVVLGIIISAAYFFLWVVVLSWADVSWALPMNAIEFVFVALLAIFMLREKIDLNRWIGMGLIGTGILLIMKSWK